MFTARGTGGFYATVREFPQRSFITISVPLEHLAEGPRTFRDPHRCGTVDLL